MPHNPGQSVEVLPDAVSRYAEQEKFTRLKGSLAALHMWFARRPSVLARTATYLALTDQQTLEPEFVEALSEPVPNPTTIATASMHIRDTQWRWAWREYEHRLDEDVGEQGDLQVPRPARVLDPFAGGGSIPAEAARLGCDAYAADLDPIAYHILRAGLQFPASYGSPNPTVPGTGPAGRWAGLVSELTYWAQRMASLATMRTATLFPAASITEGGFPSSYLWLQVTRCPNPACGATIPMQTSLRLSQVSALRRGGAVTAWPGTARHTPDRQDGASVHASARPRPRSPRSPRRARRLHAGSGNSGSCT